MDEQKIINGLLNMDRQVIEYLYKWLGPRVISYVKVNSGTYEDGQDHFQLCLMKMWETVSKNGFQLQNKFEAFFFSIVRNRWKDELRYRKPRMTKDINPDITQVEGDGFDAFFQLIKQNKEVIALHRAIKRLPDNQQQIITWRYLDGKTNVQIAEILGLEANAVNQRMNTARVALTNFAKEEMTKLNDEFGVNKINKQS